MIIILINSEKEINLINFAYIAKLRFKCKKLI